MNPRFPRWFPPAPLFVAAVLSGILVTLCFPTAAVDWLVFVALVPVFSAVLVCRPSRHDSFRTGFVFGISCYVTMLWWIVKLIPSADVSIPWLMTPSLIILVLYLALYPAFFFLLTAVLTRYRRIAFVVAAPALWVILEGLRARGELAFPWGDLGYALSYRPLLIQSAAWFGVPGLTFAIVLVNALVAGAVIAVVRRHRVAGIAIAALVVSGMALHGRMAIANYSDGGATPIRVAVIQPNIDLDVKWKPEFQDSTRRLVERQSIEAVAKGADLIVFPETCAPVYIESHQAEDQSFKRALVELAAALNTPIYIGFLDHRYDGPGHSLNIYNSSGVFLPDGELLKYDKNHLLPFGEALPLATRLRWLRDIDFGQANFQPGAARPPLDTGKARITPLICFEAVFPYLCARGVNEGSELFVNITNDGWFSDTPGPFQHAEMAVLRAVEFRRYLVRSANSGISMVVTPTGLVADHLGLYVGGILMASVVPLTGKTVYARFGDLPVLATCALLVVLAVVVVRRRVD